MGKLPWYLSTWFIASLFAFWFLIVPLIIGILLLNKQKKSRIIQEKEFRDEIEKKSTATEEQRVAVEKELALKTITYQIIKLVKEREIHTEKIANLESALEEKEEEIEEIKSRNTKNLSIQALVSNLKIMGIIKGQKDELENREKEMDLWFKQRELEINRREEVIKTQHKEMLSTQLAHHIKCMSIVRTKRDELRKLEEIIRKRKQRLRGVFQSKHKQINDLNKKIKILKREIIELDEELLFQSFGIYEDKFGLENSQEYMYYIKVLREKQKEQVKNKFATHHLTNWTLNGSKRKGDANNNQNIKLAIKAFNNECDTVISNVKFSNIDASEKRIRKFFDSINKLNRYNSIEITKEYLSLKLEELFLVYEYRKKKEEEKEEQRRIREMMREDQRAQKEMQERLKQLRKEEQKFEYALNNSSRMDEQSINKIKAELAQIRRQKEEMDYRINNAKAGFVYVISNIGSFGENIYKIGMTRRLEPQERIRELGSASVPFRFDVHAIIFSDDAPKLEASLHRTFNHRRVNRVNQRKEFFNVELSEIKKVVEQNHNAVIEFTMKAEAQEYRETKVMEKKIAKQHIV